MPARQVRGLRIGIVVEGFGWGTLSEADVDEAVRDAAHAFERLGCSVIDLSVPWHRDGPHVWNAIALEGATALMVAGNSMGANWKGQYTDAQGQLAWLAHTQHSTSFRSLNLSPE